MCMKGPDDDVTIKLQTHLKEPEQSHQQLPQIDPSEFWIFRPHRVPLLRLPSLLCYPSKVTPVASLACSVSPKDQSTVEELLGSEDLWVRSEELIDLYVDRHWEVEGLTEQKLCDGVLLAKRFQKWKLVM